MSTATAAKPKVTKPRVKDRPLLIGGKWQDSVSGKTFATLDPATGETICQVAEGDRADVDLAVKAARKAFESGPWPRMNASERGRLLNKLADLIEQNAEELAALESLDNGKPYSVAMAADLPLTLWDALAALREATILPRWLGADYPEIYATVKQAEFDAFLDTISRREWEWYL